jgi:hypothetical protein
MPPFCRFKSIKEDQKSFDAFWSLMGREAERQGASPNIMMDISEDYLYENSNILEPK